MGYNDAKSFHGRSYTGMTVGGRHDWHYPDGRWIEEKISPDQWSFQFRSPKRRKRPAPEGSGAPPGTMFHWLVLAHQRVRKVDENTYETFMDGAKWKLAHRRPQWRKWSSEYAEGTPARDRTISILEDTLARLKAERDAGAPRLEALLAPDVYGRRSTLDEFVRPDAEELLADVGE